MLCSKCHESADALTDSGLCPDCHMADEERRLDVIELAREQHQREGVLEIDDDAKLSEGSDNGCYVAAWVWVDFAGTKFEKDKTGDADQKCDGCGATVTEIIGCPDGAEICQDCFDAGQH